DRQAVRQSPVQGPGEQAGRTLIDRGILHGDHRWNPLADQRWSGAGEQPTLFRMAAVTGAQDDKAQAAPAQGELRERLILDRDGAAVAAGQAQLAADPVPQKVQHVIIVLQGALNLLEGGVAELLQIDPVAQVGEGRPELLDLALLDGRSPGWAL